MTEWLPIRYRAFYDLPRMVVVEYQGKLFLLDSRFERSVDEYSQDFIVYDLPRVADAILECPSWEGLASLGKALGTIPTASITFDPTRRRAIAADLFERISN